MKDWIDNVNGIQYGFDAANRLTTVTDYDGVEKITYGYDTEINRDSNHI